MNNKKGNLSARVKELESKRPADPLTVQIIWQVTDPTTGEVTERPGPLYVYNKPGQAPEIIQPAKKGANK